jgi:hypothetical protein
VLVHVRHGLRASRPTNELFVFAVEKGPPRKCSRFLELIASVPADYTPIFMNQS